MESSSKKGFGAKSWPAYIRHEPRLKSKIKRMCEAPCLKSNKAKSPPTAAMSQALRSLTGPRSVETISRSDMYSLAP
ncbi:hypothetical protein HispidOSU_008337 [Sigmodon hispidus]